MAMKKTLLTCLLLASITPLMSIADCSTTELTTCATNYSPSNPNSNPNNCFNNFLNNYPNRSCPTIPTTTFMPLCNTIATAGLNYCATNYDASSPNTNPAACFTNFLNNQYPRACQNVTNIPTTTISSNCDAISAKGLSYCATNYDANKPNSNPAACFTNFLKDQYPSACHQVTNIPTATISSSCNAISNKGLNYCATNYDASNSNFNPASCFTNFLNDQYPSACHQVTNIPTATITSSCNAICSTAQKFCANNPSQCTSNFINNFQRNLYPSVCTQQLPSCHLPLKMQS